MKLKSSLLDAKINDFIEHIDLLILLKSKKIMHYCILKLFWCAKQLLLDKVLKNKKQSKVKSMFITWLAWLQESKLL